ncbi:MAG: patatin-like phospholipase family protein [Anaerolineae bacterium]|nr:patatin-like phospholipase family protein [Anaerolineae bacterium]
MAGEQVERALVLSGGGGRGAYQVGVCRVLRELGWEPDLVLGNSIGATNGALFLAPKRPMPGAALLSKVWLDEMLNDKLHNVSQQWPAPLAELMSLVIEGLQSLQTPPDLTRSEENVSFGLGNGRFIRGLKALFAEGDVHKQLSQHLLHGFRAPFENGMQRTTVMVREGWRELLENNVDFDKLNAPTTPYLGIAATDVATGALHIFWNRVPDGVRGTASYLTVDHVMASSSIPGFYEATQVEGRYWWDGALIANTPIAPAIQAGATDIVVVLMTPWHEGIEAGVPLRGESPTVLDALDRVLDWMMLATLRSELDRLDDDARQQIKIIAPDATQGLVSIIDYATMDNTTLIQHGIQDARKVLQRDA